MTKEKAPDPVLDFERDYADVIGDPVAKYMQDYHFFNAAGLYCGEAPAAHKVGAPEKKLSERAKRAKALVEAARRAAQAEDEDTEALEAASKQVESQLGARAGRAVPETIVDETRENARALQAEQQAE